MKRSSTTQADQPALTDHTRLNLQVGYFTVGMLIFFPFPYFLRRIDNITVDFTTEINLEGRLDTSSSECRIFYVANVITTT
ncbi:unnamed protein product [Onchocerca flexuosa]|uniref:Transmembrane protein 231 n=1 Tax=Onchocerca flexuosa TaxID=387005 RepID=A0A183I1F6_9BILA|nr:unnamed protein product [Onchocerca flexuosa]